MVYGYMNRGEYEGRVGIVLYRYDSLFDRIEEQIYIPNSLLERLTKLGSNTASIVRSKL